MSFLSRLFGKKQDQAPPRDVAALTAPLAVPAVHVVKADAPSRSHFGGAPNLPSGVSWPEYNGVKLSFLARLSLQEMQRAQPFDWLPGTGALLFFYDMEEQPWGFDPKHRGGSAVLHVPDLPEPAGQGDQEPEGSSSLPHRNVDFRRIAVLPSSARESMDALGLTEQEADELCRIEEAPFQGLPKHQVSGFPVPIQSDAMELECQLASNGVDCGDPSGYDDPRVPELKPGAASWRLLLQLDTDDDLGVMWGDAGTLYFWVEEHRAQAGDFTNTWLILQCG